MPLADQVNVELRLQVWVKDGLPEGEDVGVAPREVDGVGVELLAGFI